MWYGIWKLLHRSLHKMFWVPQWYPYYPKTLLIHLNYRIGSLSMERTNVTLQANVVPNGTQKTFLLKNINSELSSAVPIICIDILDQKLHPTQCSWFFDIPSILRKYHFFVQNDDKIFNFYKDAKTHPDFIMTYAIRRLKA